MATVRIPTPLRKLTQGQETVPVSAGTIGELISDYVGGKIPGDIHKENIELRKSTII